MNDFKITHGIWAHHTFGLLTCELFIFLKWIFTHQCYSIVLNPQPFFKKKKEFQKVFISRFYWCMTPPPIAVQGNISRISPVFVLRSDRTCPESCKWLAAPLVLICPLPRLVRPQSKDSAGQWAV